MQAAVCTISHSPLIGLNDPGEDVQRRVETAFDQARSFVSAFDPELVVLFAPDHYNGFFYDIMPPFCIGSQARAVGDYNSPAGELSVDRAAARDIAERVLASGVDVAVSERMQVDHGFAQPLQILFGGLNAVPVVPIFINSVAGPLGPVFRARKLGQAVGEALSFSERRVLFLGSGGLSHDPPVPQLEGASVEVAARLIDGRNPTPQQRAARQEKVVQAGLDLASEISPIRALNPSWDEAFLDILQGGDLTAVDGWTNEWCVRLAGNSSHEVRTWIAAYGALATAGSYEVTYRFYEPIDVWIAGFAVTTARLRTDSATSTFPGDMTLS